MDEEFDPFADFDDPWPKPAPLDTLEPTWWVMDREPGMDDLAEQAGDSLKQMQDDLQIFPFQDRGKNDRLFLARFELPKYDEKFQYPDAVFAEGDVSGFIDFLGGFPVDDVEMMVVIGQFSSKAKEGEDSKVTVQPGTGVAAPVPTDPAHFFKWPEADKVLFSLTALPTKGVAKMLAKSLEGEPVPNKTHWWLRFNMTEDPATPKKWPVPGEFLALGVRMMPDVPWGRQKSSPFIWSGNWVDTVFYTSAVITEVLDPDDNFPYPRYKVQWRKDVIQVNPSDFAEYRVGDRVTLMKDVSADKKSQLWKDDDMKKAGDTWQICPITFYGLDQEG